MPKHVVLMTLGLVFVAAACSGSNNNTGGTGGGSGKSLSCPFSSAKSGTLCQVNFNCPDGGGPAVYCAATTGDCACGAAASSPKHFSSADFCTDVLTNSATRAAEANTACGFGL